MSTTVYTALIIVAEGAEEMEAVITIDVLRRAGISVTVAGLTGDAPVKCSRGVCITPEKSLAEATENDIFDVVILPGGLGGTNLLASSSQVGDCLRKQEEAGRYIAAICAAPLALKAHSIGYGKILTSHPSTMKDMMQGGIYEYANEAVVVHETLITSRGPGTAFKFALTIIETLLGKPSRAAMEKELLLNEYY